MILIPIKIRTEVIYMILDKTDKVNKLIKSEDLIMNPSVFLKRKNWIVRLQHLISGIAIQVQC